MPKCNTLTLVSDSVVNDLHWLYTQTSPVKEYWRKFGIQLGVTNDILTGIARSSSDTSDCLKEVLTHWVANAVHPSSNILCLAMANLKEEIMQKLEDKSPMRISYFKLLTQFVLHKQMPSRLSDDEKGELIKIVMYIYSIRIIL